MPQQATTKSNKRRSDSKSSEAGPSGVERDAKKAKIASAATAEETGSRPAQTLKIPPVQKKTKEAPSNERSDNAESLKTEAGPSTEPLRGMASSKDSSAKKSLKRKQTDTCPSGSKIRKLAPPRPFPTVPTSVSATGPRSAHTEGKSYICVTRKTPLGAYLRRCKDIIVKDGYKTLHLHALGAAIPHLARLAVSLPPILPFASDEIHSEVRTGTAELRDEVVPDNEDEDVSIRTRGKSTMTVVIRIGDGEDEAGKPANFSKGKGKETRKERKDTGFKETGKAVQLEAEQIVFAEDDQSDDDMET
ncbi:hypothetical protein DFH11DRAFT_1575117 [Phellopilus nigrolimitatus]|nr:hypothetical protein DFH11DRAFT_1575117 [Phellopilus nigrolimitatus]